MRKVFLFSLVFMFFLSCSTNESEMNLDEDGQGEEQVDGNGNSDGGASSDKDIVIGTWTLYLSTSGTEVNNCLKKSTYVFNEDNSYTYTEYDIVDDECKEIVDKNHNGEWTNRENGKYGIRRHGYTSGQDIPFKFEDNNSKMILVGRTYKRN